MSGRYVLPVNADEVAQALENVLNPDTTLSQRGKLPDAKTVGDELKKRVKTVNGAAPDEKGNVNLEQGEGQKGEKGEKGDDGITPHIGNNGNWWIGDTDTGVKAKGEKGDKGEKGEKGEKGDPGDGASITVDTELSETSTNPVQNKVVTEAFNDAMTMLRTDVVPKLLPTVAAADNGKVLRVVGGAWAAVTIESAENAMF